MSETTGVYQNGGRDWIGLAIGLASTVILILMCLGLIRTLGFYSTLSPTARMVLGGVIGAPCGLVGRYIARIYAKG